MHAQQVDARIEKIRDLPPARVAEVEDFVDFLQQRPAIVVSSAAYNRRRQDLVVMAVTSQMRPTGPIGEEQSPGGSKRASGSLR